MIRARGEGFVLFGLSRKNVELLQQGKPIGFDGACVGLPELYVMITYGETEESLAKELHAQGLLPDDVAEAAAKTAKGWSPS